MKKLAWTLAAVVFVAMAYVAYTRFSREFAIDRCLDDGGAWRTERCVH